MVRAFLFALLICPSLLHAESRISDAFGIFDPTAQPSRQDWSGHVMQNDADGGTFNISQEAATIEIFVGQKSLVQSQGIGLHAALLFDQHDNLVSNETRVMLTAGEATESAPTRNGLAHRLFSAGNETGTFFAWATLGAPNAAQSRRVTYRVVPNLRQTQLQLDRPDAPLALDAPHNLASLTGEISDDGLEGLSTVVTLDHGDMKHSVVPGLWTGTSHRALLLTRDLPGDAQAQLHLTFTDSNEVALSLDTTSQLGSPLVLATAVPDLAATRITIGPILTDQGHHISEGTLALVTITDSNTNKIEVPTWSHDGRISVLAPSQALPFDMVVTTPYGSVTATVQIGEDQP